jgi:alcohol dehydrogenase/L-iditol 2-dehydrogenase
VENSRIKPGDSVIVLGPGTIGILCAAVAKLCGADVAVLGLESDTARLSIAKIYGTTIITGDAGNWAREKDGLGADLIIDAAGVSETIRIAMDLIRPKGQITKVGWGPKPLGFSLDPLVQKNITLQGSFSHNWPIWEKVIGLLADRKLDVRPVIGGVWPLESWHEAFEKMHHGEIVKSVLKPV